MADTLGDALRAAILQRYGAQQAGPPVAPGVIPPTGLFDNGLNIPMAGGDLSPQVDVAGGMARGSPRMPPEWTAALNYRRKF